MYTRGCRGGGRAGRVYVQGRGAGRAGGTALLWLGLMPPPARSQSPAAYQKTNTVTNIIYTLSTHYLYTVYTLSIHHLYTIYTLSIHSIFIYTQAITSQQREVIALPRTTIKLALVYARGGTQKTFIYILLLCN